MITSKKAMELVAKWRAKVENCEITYRASQDYFERAHLQQEGRIWSTCADELERAMGESEEQ